jgi:hypothetical protein
MPSDDYKPKPRWTEEEKKILRYARITGMKFSQIVALLPHRSPGALRKMMATLDPSGEIPTPSKRIPFTAAEDCTILKAHDEEGHSFAYISRYMSTRSTTVIHARYKELEAEGRTRPNGDWEGRDWQLEEDDRLRHLLNQHETEMPPWTFFEQDFEDRSAFALVRRATALGWKPPKSKVDLYSKACSWTLQEDITIRSAALEGKLNSELYVIGSLCEELGYGKTAEEVLTRWQFLQSLTNEEAGDLAIMQQRNPTEAERFYHNWLEREKRWGMQHSDTPVDKVQGQSGIGEAKEGNLEDLCAPIPPGEYGLALEQSACTTTVSPSSSARQPAGPDSEDTSVRPSERRLAPTPPTRRL